MVRPIFDVICNRVVAYRSVRSGLRPSLVRRRLPASESLSACGFRMGTMGADRSQVIEAARRRSPRRSSLNAGKLAGGPKAGKLLDRPCPRSPPSATCYLRENSTPFPRLQHLLSPSALFRSLPLFPSLIPPPTAFESAPNRFRSRFEK